MEGSNLYTENDGLTMPEVGEWSKKKYSLVYEYDCLFSTGMKKNWQQRVYIDLFSGAGKARLRNSEKCVNTSALLSLLVKDKFDKYIFCDIDGNNIEALKTRVKAIHSEDNIVYLQGDANELASEIIENIPTPSTNNKTLSFCFVDPFSLNIKFDTIKKLSKYFMDFLMLHAFGMDGKRNIQIYAKENYKRIDYYLGLNDWRALDFKNK